MNYPDPISRVGWSFVSIVLNILHIGSMDAIKIPAAISTNMAQSVCHEMKRFTETSELQPPVKSKPQSATNNRCGWYRWGNCDGRDSVCSYNGFENCKGEDSSRIVNGEDAVPNSCPSLGSFSYTASKMPGCSGAIIAKNIILTAAHCTVDAVGRPVKKYFVAGEHTISVKEPHEQTVQLQKCVEHPDWCALGENGITGGPDISLCLTAEPFTFNEFVAPAKLPPHGSVASGRVMSVGWGDIERNESLPADVLQQAERSVITDADCKKFEHAPRNLTDIVCVNEPGKASCVGDSGSPLYKITGKIHTVFGTISKGSLCKVGQPTFYTDVVYFLPWIEV